MTTLLTAAKSLKFSFALETPLERAIATAPDWLMGLEWGQPRPGHPEGKVGAHIRDVLQNIDRFYHQAADRANLRLIALIHDTFKYQTAHQSSAAQGQSHGYRARVFAETYIDDAAVLQVIEHHDDAYKIWRRMTKERPPASAEIEARALMAELGDHLGLFLRFYLCDNQTAGKSIDHFVWFKQVAASDGR